MATDPSSKAPVQALHHIGIAVRSLAEALPRWTEGGLGLVLQSTDEVPTERVRVAVLMAGDTRIELLEPTSPDSPMSMRTAWPVFGTEVVCNWASRKSAHPDSAGLFVLAPKLASWQK